MADRVIVVGVKRARQAVPISEIKQMVGRGGRKHGGAVCYATIVAESELLVEVENGMEDDANLKVESSLGESGALAFHVLPEICHQNVTGVDEAKAWYGRSFGAYQGLSPDFDGALDLLRETQAIVQEDDKLRATDLGMISSRLYLHPADVWAWRDNFDTVFGLGLEKDDAALAWALGTVPFTRMAGDFGERHWGVVEEYRNEIPVGLQRSDGTIVTATLWKYLLGGLPVGKMKNQALALRRDCDRICQSLQDLNRVMGWGKPGFFNELSWRCKRGIPANLVELCRLPGINKGKALFLKEHGIETPEDVGRELKNIEDEVDEPFLATLRNIASCHLPIER